MSNVHILPGITRQALPDTHAIEREILELQRDRAKVDLANAKLENTIARSVNFTLLWRAIKHAIFWGFVLWLFVVMFGAGAKAEPSTSRSFYSGSGSFAGSSVTRGNSSSFYDKSGSFSGTAIRHGNSTSFYDGRGHFTGSSINTGPRK